MTEKSRPAPAAWRGSLETLSNAVGPSGSEGPVRSIVRRRLADRVDSLDTDRLGNVLAVKHARGAVKLRVMLAAHMDEVGFMVKAIDPQGFLQVVPLGSVQADQLLGKRVWVGRDARLGVVGVTPIHLASSAERGARPSFDSLRIDLGMSPEDLARAGIRAGVAGTFAGDFVSDSTQIWGKALDDRLGVALLLELLGQSFESVELLAAFTVQEELGGRGAAAAAYALEPDVGIAIDCTPARDVPMANGQAFADFNTRVGAGPAISVADGRMASDPRLVELALQTAEAEGLPHQIRQPGSGSTDAAAIQRARGGIASLAISVPGRYSHTATSLVKVADAQATLDLLSALIRALPDGFPGE